MADTYLAEVFGMDTFSMGAVGANGTMGGTLTTYPAVKDNTMTFDMPAPTKNNVNIYESDSAYAVMLSGVPRKISLELMGLKLSELPDFLGGAFVAGVAGTKDTWTEPATFPTIIQSVFVGTKDKNGNVVGMNFLRCQVTGGQSLTPSKTDGFGVQIELEILTPFNASGVAQGARQIVGEIIPA